jgi:hypothetical protein
MVYLSTKNLSLPKGRASKLCPKFVGPYKVLKALHDSSNYELELPPELVKRKVFPRFHISLLRPHVATDEELFPNRRMPDAYDFGAPEDTEWWVNEILDHKWKGKELSFLVEWNVGDTTWESIDSCNELAALDRYLELMGVEDWPQLPKKKRKERPATQPNRRRGRAIAR